MSTPDYFLRVTQRFDCGAVRDWRYVPTSAQRRKIRREARIKAHKVRLFKRFDLPEAVKLLRVARNG